MKEAYSGLIAGHTAHRWLPRNVHHTAQLVLLLRIVLVFGAFGGFVTWLRVFCLS